MLWNSSITGQTFTERPRQPNPLQVVKRYPRNVMDFVSFCTPPLPLPARQKRFNRAKSMQQHVYELAPCVSYQCVGYIVLETIVNTNNLWTTESWSHK